MYIAIDFITCSSQLVYYMIPMNIQLQYVKEMLYVKVHLSKMNVAGVISPGSKVLITV